MRSRTPTARRWAAVPGNSFSSRASMRVGEYAYEVHRLDAVGGSQNLPFSLKILLENLLRSEGTAGTTADDVSALANWDPAEERAAEIQFAPARVIMQDFTGVPAIVDLAAMREAMRDLGGDP